MSEPPEPTSTTGPALKVVMHRGPMLCHGRPAPACASSPRQPGGGSSPKSAQCRPFHTPGSEGQGQSHGPSTRPPSSPRALGGRSGRAEGGRCLHRLLFLLRVARWRGGGPRGSQAEAQSPCGQLQSPGDRMSNALNFIWKERGYAMGFAEN